MLCNRLRRLGACIDSKRDCSLAGAESAMSLAQLFSKRASRIRTKPKSPGCGLIGGWKKSDNLQGSTIVDAGRAEAVWSTYHEFESAIWSKFFRDIGGKVI